MDNGKTYEDEKGYLRFKDSDKLVHRWVAAKKYGGEEQIRDKEVHHLDGNKRNNNHNNIILLSKEDHYHLQEHEKKHAPRERFMIKTWAVVLLAAAVIIQIPFWWVPYVTQFITVVLVLVAMLGLRYAPRATAKG